ncbi:MAG: Holliday junction resolvase RuvX [Acidimicrobiia bacterium]
MSCDFGLARIGVALSDLSNTLATPHDTIRRTGDEYAEHTALISIAQEHEVDHIIAGIPTSLRGHPTAQAAEYAAEAERLSARSAIPVTCMDERFTTVIAQRQRTQRAKKGRVDIDAEAAAVLLQDFLDRTRQDR